MLHKKRGATSFNELAGNGFLVTADQPSLALVPSRTAGASDIPSFLPSLRLLLLGTLSSITKIGSDHCNDQRRFESSIIDLQLQGFCLDTMGTLVDFTKLCDNDQYNYLSIESHVQGKVKSIFFQRIV